MYNKEKTPQREWLDFLGQYMDSPRPEDRMPIDHREFLQKIKLYFDNKEVVCDGKIDLSYVYFRIKSVIDEFIDRDFRHQMDHMRSDIRTLADKTTKSIFDLKKEHDKDYSILNNKIKELERNLNKELESISDEMKELDHRLAEGLQREIGIVKHELLDMIHKLEGKHEKDISDLNDKIDQLTNDINEVIETVVNDLREELTEMITKVNDNLTEMITEVNDKVTAISDSIGQPGGIATLDEDGKVPDDQLPSWTDDIIEVFADYTVGDDGKLTDIHLYTDFKKLDEITEGEEGKIYIDISQEDPTYMFRWTGKKFIQIDCGGTILGTTKGTAYDGAEGQYNRDAIKSTPEKIVVGINEKDSVATASSYELTVDVVTKDSNDQYTGEDTQTVSIPLVNSNSAGLMSPVQKETLDTIDETYVNQETLDEVVTDLQDQIDKIEESTGSANDGINDLKDEIDELKTKHDEDIAEVKDEISAVDDKVTAINDSIGQPDGIASLDSNGQVPSSQLPSYVDDIVDVFATYEKAEDGSLYNIHLYKDAAHTEAVVGETDKIYVDISQDAGPEDVGTLPYYQFRWSGTKFVQITCGGLILGDVEGTAYEGSKGAYNRAAINALPGEVVVSISDKERTEDDIKYNVTVAVKDGSDQYSSTEDKEIIIPKATTTNAGLMTAEDKATFDAIPDTYVTKDEYDGEDKNLQDEIDALKEQHDKDVETLQENIDSLNTKIDDSVKTLQDNIDNLNYEEHECEEAIENLNTAVSDLEKKHDDDVDSLKTDIADNTSKIDELESTISTTNNDLSNLESRVTTNESNIATNAANISTLNDTATDLQKQIDADEESIDLLIESKQDVLTAGTGIAINEINGETVIECTIDHTIYKVVSELPEKPDAGDENKIFCVPSAEQGEKDIYTEYIYVTDAWEKIGEFTPEIDLTPYAKIADVDAQVADLQSQITSNKESIDKNTEGITTLTNDLNSLTDKVDSSDNNINELITKVDTNTEDIAVLKNGVDDLTNRVTTNESNIATNTSDIADLSDSKQDKLTAGDGISINTINGETIIANTQYDQVVENTSTLNDVVDTLNTTVDTVNTNTSDIETLKSDVEGLSDSKQDVLTAGDGISINTVNGENVIANTQYDQVNTNTDDIASLKDEKQDVLTAGTGIDITNNTISCTLDTTIYEVVKELPTENIDPNKIYVLVNSAETTEDNECIEYLYIDGGWEKIGEFKPDTDFSDYYTKEEVDEKINDVQSQVTDNSAIISDLTTKVDTNTSDISDLNTKIAELETTEGTDASDISDLKDKVESNTADISTLRDDVDENTSNINSLISTTDDLQKSVSDLEDTKQDALTAGDGISINTVNSENVIANTQYDQVNTNTDDIASLKDEKQDALTAGDGISINTVNGENVITNTQYDQVNTNTDDIASLKDEKQDVLTAGTGIDITDNVITVTLDTTLYKIESVLPDKPDEGDENKIFIIPDSTGGEPGNIWVEYIYVENAWELIGKFQPETDLSGYVTKDEYDTKVSELENNIKDLQDQIDLIVQVLDRIY